MLNQKNRPTVFHYDGVSYADISFKMLSYGRDTYVAPLTTTHFVYFGRHKPFRSLYVEMSVVNTNASTMAVEYYDGSSWVAVSNLVDDTNGFTRSGFVEFDAPDDWSSSSVNSVANYWARVSFSANLLNTTALQGMSLVFSDDQDLNAVYPGVSNYLNSTETSFILRHENSRNLIVQDVRNNGLRKRRIDRSYYENIDAWDLLNVEEVRQWSTYLTLANIFSSLQSNQSDWYKEKAEEFRREAELYKAAFYLSVDKNDDGEADPDEASGDISVRRLVRR